MSHYLLGFDIFLLLSLFSTLLLAGCPLLLVNARYSFVAECCCIFVPSVAQTIQLINRFVGANNIVCVDVPLINRSISMSVPLHLAAEAQV
jgi:hypothetical protein